MGDFVQTLAPALAIGVGVNILGKLVLDRMSFPRSLMWTVAIAPLVGIHFLMLDGSVFLRVVALCSVLLCGMKLIVYSEWLREGGRKLSWGRWLCFSFLWFGMEPRAWVVQRKTRAWHDHAVWGGVCILIGSFGLTVMGLLDISFYPLAFIFMSMMFHFGVLRLTTAFWRMMGFPVRTLFRNPLVTSGFADFWGNRWNLAYSQMMARAVQRPLTPLIGRKPTIFLVFLISGLFHELAITLPAQAGYGLPTLFFTLHGIAVLVEGKGVWLRYACLAALVAGIPVLFPPTFAENVILPVHQLWNQLIGL